MTIFVNWTRQIMTCEPIDIIYLLLELVILNLNAMKGHTEFWGRPLVLYCTVCNIPLTKIKFTCNFLV